MRTFPKVDLHRHLEGSISPDTLVRIASKYGGELPACTVEGLRPYIHMTAELPGFSAFLQKFQVYRGFYTCREAIEYAAYTAVMEAALDAVKYLELRYSPTHFAGPNRFRESDVIEWINAAIKKASEVCDIIVIPVLTISRDFGRGLAEKTVRYVSRLKPGPFYGLDIAGNEAVNSARPFSDLFALAKKSGLHLTIHAGEACGPLNVLEAVTVFKAERIGHGVRSVEDPALMALLREKRILLELCLTSNVHTGVVPSLGAHPIRRLMEAGVPVSINTDDPAISDITLSGEYVAAVTHLGFTESELKAVNLEALDHAFHPDKENLKRRLAHFWK
ncbi:MAG: adenosine deaminase [Deltaproteobacteria bacterium]|nr:adenosine deaminase [Deltaproteobacteria bacterium]